MAVAVVLQISTCHSFNIQPRMLNGFAAELSDYPYYVFISTYIPNGIGRYCGGTLISDTYVCVCFLKLISNITK